MFPDIKNQIIRKLFVEGVRTSNFGEEKCKAILQRCVAPAALIKYFNEYQIKIYNGIAEMQAEEANK